MSNAHWWLPADHPLRRGGSRRARPEADAEAPVMALYGAIGATVNKNSARVHVKGVTKGTGDVYLQHEEWACNWWHETKVPGKRQSAEQWAFMGRCRATATPYVLGGVTEAEDFLIWLGIAKRLAGAGLQLEQDRRLWGAIVEPQRADGFRAWWESAAFASQFARFGYKQSRHT